MTHHLSNEPAVINGHRLPIAVIDTKYKCLFKIARRSLTLGGLMILVACHEAESIDSIDTASTVSAEPVKSMRLDLSTTALDKPAFLGLVEPPEKPVAPCPFLSDETAFSIVKTDWILKRRDTSNERCYWSKNLGFSVKLTVEPLATAKPLSTRVYNLESKPVLKSQAEPGINATILYDTVWDKERAYAMSFEQNNKLVMITVTGLATDAERLTAAAMEVADKLPTAAVFVSQDDKAGSFDVCSTWRKSDIEAILGIPVQTTLGSLDCKWESTTEEGLKQIRVTIYSGQSYPWESVLEQGASEIPGIGERGLMERKRKKGSMPAHVLLNTLYDERLVTVSITDTIADHEAVALALSKNIDSRF